MAYPPEFDKNKFYPEYKNLEKYDVFMEKSGTNPMFLELSGLPTILTYGKHYALLSVKNPKGQPFYLKPGTDIEFEVKDGLGNLIYSELADSGDIELTYNGASIISIWIKKDPLTIYQEIEDGPGTITIVGELAGHGLPNKWVGKPNYRCVFPIEIRKDLPNISPIFFQSSSFMQTTFSSSSMAISPSSSISESIEIDDSSDILYDRSYINISSSHMDTYGGKISFAEISYREINSRNPEFNVLNTYPISMSAASQSISVTGSTDSKFTLLFDDKNQNLDEFVGLNPPSHTTKFPLPTHIRRYSDIEFRLRFLNSNMEYAKDLSSEDKIIEITSSIGITGSRRQVDTVDGIHISGSGGIFFGNGISGKEHGLVWRFKPSASATEEDRVDVEQVAGGNIQKKLYSFDKQGGFINDIEINQLSASSNASIIGSLSSSISSSAMGAAIASSGSKVIESKNSIVLGGIDNIIQHKAGTNDFPGSTNYGWANTIIGGNLNRISGSMSGSAQHADDYDKTNMKLNVVIGGSQNIIQADTIGEAAGKDVSSTANMILGGIQNNIYRSDYSTTLGSLTSIISSSLRSSIINSTAVHLFNGNNSVVIGMNNLTIEGKTETVYMQNLDVAGSLNVNEITSSIISSSIIYSSGSNIFGDADDDNHLFKGSISMSGNVNSSNLRADGYVSASSGIVVGPSNTSIMFQPDGGSDDVISYSSTWDTLAIASQDINLQPGNGVGVGHNLNYNNDALLDVNGDVRIKSHITGSGDLIISGTISASSGIIQKGDTEPYLSASGGNLTLSGSGTGLLNIVGDISASGNISASTIYAQTFASSSVGGDVIANTLRVGTNVAATNMEVTVEGDISASGNLDVCTSNNLADGLKIGRPGNIVANLHLLSGSSSNLAFTNVAGGLYLYSGSAITPHMFHQAGSGNVHLGAASNAAEKLTVTGNISASGDLYSNKVIVGAHPVSGSVDGITVAGNISASGPIEVGTEEDVASSISTFGGVGGDGNGGHVLSGSKIKVGASSKASASLEVRSGNYGWELGTSKQAPDVIGAALHFRQIIGNASTDRLAITTDGNITSSAGITLGNLPETVGNFSVNYGTAPEITSSLYNTNKGYGDIVSIGTSSVDAGRVYCLDSNGETWTLTDADGGCVSSSLLGVALDVSSSKGMLLRGFAQVSQSLLSTTGQKVYASTHPGSITSSLPQGSGDVVRVLGYALNTGVSNHSASIYFNPDNTWVTRT